MGAQTSKTATKAEVDAEKQEDAAVSPTKSNGQENGHTKVNGDASDAAAQDEAQVNGTAQAEEGLKEEPDKAEAEPAEKEAEDKTEAVPAAEGTAASEDGASGSGEAKKKKRFSFKKPFKLSGFSFKKNKKEAEGEAAATSSEEGASTSPEEGKEATTDEVPAVEEAGPASDDVGENQEVTTSHGDKPEETTEEEPETVTPTATEPQQKTEDAEQDTEVKPAEDSTQEKTSDSEVPAPAE